MCDMPGRMSMRLCGNSGYLQAQNLYAEVEEQRGRPVFPHFYE
jgi:hypothetical protein